MENNLLIVGAGMYALVVMDIAESLGSFDKIDFIDDHATQTPNGIAVIGTTSDISKLSKEYQNCIVAIGNPDVRLSLIKKIEDETNCKMISLISPRAYVAPSAQIAKGCVIEPMAVVHSLCQIGVGCLVSAGAVVNHASVLCDGCHADCNSTVLGNTTVPAKTKICSGEVFGKKTTPTTPVASDLLNNLKKYNNKATIMLSSSIQATLAGRFGNSEYGRSKKAGEELFFDYAKETGAKVAVYRFPNLMGHSRPKYNSFVSTLCYCVANDEEFTVNDRGTELELLYIDDLVEGMFDLLEGKEAHCEFDGVETIANANGRYCYVPVTHKVTLGDIVDLLEQFKEQPTTLMMPKMPEGSFAKKLYSLYLTYLPTEKFKYALKMNVDDRGSFTELLHTEDCGQVSINISRPGITKGQHWHNSKWELFIVVAGHGLIQERNINTGETVEFEVSGDKIEAVHMIPGWTHNIINLSETENLVTVMTCNEIFDPNKPDTFFEIV